MMKLCTAFLWLAVQCGASPIYYLATDQTGAQTQIDLQHTSSWLMTPGINFDFAGGLFTMKDGSSSFDPLTLSLYRGTDASGSLIGSVNLTNATFCAQVGNCGQFASHPFLFVAPVPLVAGTTYFAALTSPAANVQSLAYFIKNDSFFISDQNGTAIQPQPVTFGTPPASPTPEPRSLTLLAVGFGLVWGLNRRFSSRLIVS
jgi:hypothetical protein